MSAPRDAVCYERLKLEVKGMSARKKFTCAALACFLALGGAGETEAVSAAPDRWTVSIGKLDVMGAADVRVTGRLELDRPRSADLTLEGFVNGTVAVRFVPPEGSAEGAQPCGLELTGKVRAKDLPTAAITALRCSFEGRPDGVTASLPEDGLRLRDMSGYLVPEGPKPVPEFVEASGSSPSPDSDSASRGEGGCDVGLTWPALLLLCLARPLFHKKSR